MPTVRANGLDISYTVDGQGPPLVLLHGASSSAVEDWATQRPLLRQFFRLYLVDARGHAGTRWVEPEAVTGVGPPDTESAAQDSDRDGDVLARGLGIETLVADLGAFVDALGLDRFHAGGFSMGAMTALRFAVRTPQRLLSLVLVGADVEPEPGTSVARVMLDPDRIARDDPEWAAQLERRHGPVQGPGAWRRLLPIVVGAMARRPLLTPADLRRVQVPVLVVCGDRDPFVPVDHAARLKRQLPDARLLVAPDAAHLVMLTRPEVVAAGLQAFYGTLEIGGSSAPGWSDKRRAALTQPPATGRPFDDP
jgi:pimeloyl-ACP methyl ester carboxylesterase